VPIIKKKNNPLCGVYSENEFRALLKHERKRADRTGDKFSIALFDIPDSDEDINNACFLPDLITDVVRSTDEVGWLDKDHIGVLLVDTPREGAQEVVKKFFQEMASEQYLCKYHIFTYPSLYFLDTERPALRAPDPQIPQQLNLFEEELCVDTEGPHDEFPAKGSFCRKEGKGAFTGNDLRLESHLGIEIPVWKRVFDIIFATTALIVLFPFLILTAILIQMVSHGPVFFIQERIGYLGKPFNLLKFRTMKVNADTSSHEVGPRPCLPSEFQEYLHWHKRRFYTLPGITGLWQVNGKHKLTFKQMIRYDITYEQQRSFWLDFKIIIGTFPTVYRLTTDG